MPAHILDGKAIAAGIRSAIAATVSAREHAGQRPPGLAVVLVGDDAASDIYVRAKARDCAQVGFKSAVHRLPADVEQARLMDLVDELNADASIDGFLLQMPLPAHLDPEPLLEAIHPAKDVDGYHPYNIGRLALRHPKLRSCTPKGIMTLLDHTGLPLRGMDACVVGASNEVGRPMALELLLAGCTVTTCHKFTRDTRTHVERAEILVSATGRAGLIRGAWVREGAVVVDVGISRQPDGRILGDVEFERAAERAAWITPVPGGVGPMTRASLLENTLAACELRDPSPAP